MRVLLVEEDLDTVLQIQPVVEACGYQVDVAHDVETGLLTLHEGHSTVVLLSHDYADEATIHQFSAGDFPVFVVVILYDYTDDHAFEVLRHGASNWLRLPLNAKLLDLLVSKYENAANEMLKQSQVLGLIAMQHTKIVMPNDSKLITPIAEFIVSHVHARYPNLDMTGVRLGLEEIIRNAYEHGNLEIGFDTKAAALADNSFHDLVSRRQLDPAYAGRRVEIEFRIEEDILSVSVEDDGKGFDYSKQRDPLTPQNVVSLNGRGIFLTKAYFDELQYLGRGNRVVMRKRLVNRPSGVAHPKLAGSEI